MEPIKSPFVAYIGGSIDCWHEGLTSRHRCGRNPQHDTRRVEVALSDQDRGQGCGTNYKQIKMGEGLPDRETREVDWQRGEQKRRETERKKCHTTE
jgi:hypothetical protein